NIIKDYQVIEKRPLSLPDEIHEIAQCNNPNCITNHQNISTFFNVIKDETGTMLKCHYCERLIKLEEVKIK
ncbi:MAG TPA: aspartate carbamoyltransferase regulatory subunit, partial [Paludibacteraceae bacterium]|nr:aspartate carbamoyltransferase regulatory subunit [Paludibacteraceae bacterium]